MFKLTFKPVYVGIIAAVLAVTSMIIFLVMSEGRIPVDLNVVGMVLIAVLFGVTVVRGAIAKE